MGWEVDYKVPCAVWKNTDGVDLHIYNVYKNALGSSVMDRTDRKEGKTVSVPSVDIANFVKIIKKKYKPDVIMGKLDIEGGEYQVLPSLEENGLLCAEHGFDIITYEFHTFFHGADKKWSVPRTFPPCVTETLMVELDSESYYNDGKPFPRHKHQIQKTT